MTVRCAAFFPALILVFTGSSIVSAQEQLAWKFTPGESLKYVVRQNMEMTMEVASKQQKILMNQTMDMQWKISDVDPGSGDVNMAQSVERVQMDSQGGPIGTISFDSASGEVPDTPYGRSIAAVFKKLIGEKFGVRMKSSGKIDQVTVPESLIAALRQSGSTGNSLDEATLKQLMTQSAITLPEKPIQPGDTWDSEQHVEMPVGTMTVRSKLTFRGIEPSTGLATISMTPAISLTPKQGSAVNLTLSKTEGHGELLFDAVRGRIVKSDLELTMQMQMKTAGQVIDQTIHQKTSMTLAR